MKRLFCGVIMLITVLTIFPNVSNAKDYLLGPRDVLSISVWGHEDLTVKESAIREDGKISLPITGELLVAGLSVSQLTEIISNSLRDYINNPMVIVNILKYHTTRIYVLGEVVKPGVYELEKQHNVLDAISAAGGYTKDASKKRIFVISQGDTGKPKEIDLLNLIKKGDMTQNISLTDGDLVFLADNHRIDILRDIVPIISATYDIQHFND